MGSSSRSRRADPRATPTCRDRLAMIVLDTNVVSEPLRERPNPAVMMWLQNVASDATFTAVTAGELLTGVAYLPSGRRRDDLAQRITDLLTRYRPKILPLDTGSAQALAVVRATRRRSGRPITTEDAWIAAICLARDVPLATRNVPDFEDLGLEIINPWNLD